MVSHRVVVLLFLVLAAGGDSQDVVFAVEMVDGSTVVGTLDVAKIQIDGAFGLLDLELDKIASITFGDEDIVTTVRQSTLKGRIKLESLRLKADVGDLDLARGKIRRICRQDGESSPKAAAKAKPILPTYFGMFASRDGTYVDCKKARVGPDAKLEDLPSLPPETHFLLYDRAVAMGAGSEAVAYRASFVRYKLLLGMVGKKSLKELAQDEIHPSNRWTVVDDEKRRHVLHGAPVEGHPDMVVLAPEAALPPGVYSLGRNAFGGADFLFAVAPSEIDLYTETVDAHMTGMHTDHQPASVFDKARGVRRPPKEPAKARDPAPVATSGSGGATPEPRPAAEGGGFRHGTLVRRDDADELIAATPANAQFTHPGVDVAGVAGQPVQAMASGLVADIVAEGEDAYSYLGNAVMIENEITVRGRKTFTIYLHLQDGPTLKPGDKVVAGTTTIGSVGSTGAAEDPHTHFEVRHFRDWLLGDVGWMPLKQGKPSRNIYGRGDQRFTWRFFENWTNPDLFLEVMKGAPRGGHELAARINSELERINKAMVARDALDRGPEWRAASDSLVADFVDALQLIRLARLLDLKPRDADGLTLQEAFSFANVALYWAEVHSDSKETVLWLEAAFKGGLLRHYPLDKLLVENALDPVRDDPEFRKLIERYR